MFQEFLLDKVSASKENKNIKSRKINGVSICTNAFFSEWNF
jgi:hypothetical protein